MKTGHERFIELFVSVRIENAPEDRLARGYFRTRACRAENSGENFETVRPAEPDQSNGAAPRGRGKSANGVSQVDHSCPCQMTST